MLGKVILDDDMLFFGGVGTVRLHNQQFALPELILALPVVHATQIIQVISDFESLFQSLGHLH